MATAACNKTRHLVVCLVASSCGHYISLLLVPPPKVQAGAYRYAAVPRMLVAQLEGWSSQSHSHTLPHTFLPTCHLICCNSDPWLKSCAPCLAISCRRAREKRELLRSAHLAPDYIPLGGAAALTSRQGITSTPLTTSGPQPVAAAAIGSGTSGDSDSASEGEAPDSRMTFVGGNPSASAASRRKGAASTDALSSLQGVRYHTCFFQPCLLSLPLPPSPFIDGATPPTYCFVADVEDRQRCALLGGYLIGRVWVGGAGGGVRGGGG